MAPPLRLVLALHNHQPVGNFDGVFEQAYRESYLPFLDVLEDYPSIRFALHNSGCLTEWLSGNHPDYLDRVAGLVASGRVELIGGPWQEAILPMLPSRDSDVPRACCAVAPPRTRLRFAGSAGWRKTVATTGSQRGSRGHSRRLLARHVVDPSKLLA